MNEVYVIPDIYSGDSVIVADTSDTVDLSDLAWSQVRGIKETDDRTTIVFNDYSVLNILGTPGQVVVGSETLVANAPVEYTDPLSDVSAADINTSIVAYTSDVVNLSDYDITSDKVRGIKNTDERVTIGLNNNFNVFNILGKPGEVILDGQTIISNPYEEPTADSANDTLWGTTDTDIFTYNYGDGNDIFIADESDIVDLSGVSFSQILGMHADAERTAIVFDNYQSVNVFGRAGAYIIEDNFYSTSEDGSLNYEGNLSSLVNSLTSES